MEASRFAAEECPIRGCLAEVVWATERGVRLPFGARPSRQGSYQLRDTGMDMPAAIRLTAGQQFGKIGTLHEKHNCPGMKARRR